MSDDLVKRLGPILDRMDMTIEERAAHDAARIAELEADLKCVLDREAATYGRHGARITALEDERDALVARVKELEGVLAKADDELKSAGYRDAQWPRPQIAAITRKEGA